MSAPREEGPVVASRLVPGGPGARGDMLSAPLRGLLEDLASAPVAPGGGSAAAAALAMAAGLIVKAARASAPAWEHAPATAAQAQALRARVEPLVQADAEVYDAARSALSLARRQASEAGDDRRRNWALGVALERAGEVPLLIAQAAEDVAALGAETAACGEPDSRGDAVVACVLAEGAGRAALHLVEINLAVSENDERRVLLEGLAAGMAAARSRALSIG